MAKFLGTPRWRFQKQILEHIARDGGEHADVVDLYEAFPAWPRNALIRHINELICGNKLERVKDHIPERVRITDWGRSCLETMQRDPEGCDRSMW